jgi:hypothetical protein
VRGGGMAGAGCSDVLVVSAGSRKLLRFIVW